MNDKIKIIAMDMDGTLTQHKSTLEPECRAILEKMAERFHLLMVCAGSCERVYTQLGKFPIDTCAFYGMQYSEVHNEKLEILENVSVPINRDEVLECVEKIRKKFDFIDYVGESVEFHESGLITFPILGTKALLEDKLRYDPDRKKRREIYQDVCNLFKEYNVFIGGTSSFDIAPKPYNKLYALDKYLSKHNFSRENVIFFGDDYGVGGNDRDVYMSEIDFIAIENYENFPQKAKQILL